MTTFISRGEGSCSLLKDILEDVFEPAVVGFEDGVLCAHV